MLNLMYARTILSLTFLTLLSTSLYAGDAILSWNPPTTNIDGSPLTDLAGYKVYYGTTSGNYSQQINMGNVTSYTVTNLTDGLTYYFAVTAHDISGNESTYSNEVSKVIQIIDLTPPVISGVYADNISSNSATVNWTTNEASDTEVEYGTTTSYAYVTTLNTFLLTNHSQTINSLSPSTLYHYRVKSKDASGNLSASNDYTFTTSAPADTTAPVISNIQVTNITSSSATISWTTNELSTTQVEYGFTSSYGNLTTLNSNLTTVHSVTITGLSSFTTYDFRVRLKDASANEAVSGNNTFKTSNIPPVVSSLSANPATGSTSLFVTFSASASDQDGYITSYEWDLDGDGTYEINTGTSAITSFTYTNAGVYNAKVRVTDNGGASAASNVVTITVNSPTNRPLIISSFTASPSSGTEPVTVTFSATASDSDGVVVQYKLDFDGNGNYVTTDTLPVSHTYNNPGTYTAVLQAIDDKGATAASTTTVTVQASSTSTKQSSDNNSSPEAVHVKNGGCFIATAAYGSYLDPHVMVLREFRDKYLLTNFPGRVMVGFYYKVSPPAANFIAKHEILKAAVRLVLTPIVFGIEYLQQTVIFLAAMLYIMLCFICKNILYAQPVTSGNNKLRGAKKLWKLAK